MKKEGFIFQDTTRANVDNGETRHQGVEIEGRFALRDNLEVSANWTLARHRYDNNPALSRGVIQGNDIDTARKIDGRPASELGADRARDQVSSSGFISAPTLPTQTIRIVMTDMI